MSTVDVTDPVSQIREALLAAAAALRGSGPDEAGAAGHAVVAPNLERPKRAGQGDYATNAAMLLAPKLGKPPREIAELLGPAEAQSAQEIAAAAQAKLAAIDEQVRELMRQRCRLRQLVRVCEHGNGKECAALQLPELAVT